MSVLACIISNRRRNGPPPKSLLLFRFEYFQLFIETSNPRLQLIDRGVVLLHEHFVFLVRLFLLVRRQFRNVLRLLAHLQIQAVKISIHLAVVAVKILLGGNHFVPASCVPIGRGGGRLRVRTRRLGVGGKTKSENERQRYPSLHRVSSSYRKKI